MMRTVSINRAYSSTTATHVHRLYIFCMLSPPSSSTFPSHFPPILPSSSPTLPKTGDQIGREARAMMNAGNGYSTFWAPVINLAREPRWGRNIETPGEDPYLSGEYAEYFVKGMEQSPDDPYDKDSLYIQCSERCTLRNEKFHTET